MSQMQIYLIGILVVCGYMSSTQATVLNLNQPEWINFKRQYSKTYATVAEEQTALYNFNYNSKLVTNHNLYYERGTYTYSLRLNQFADLNLIKTLPTRFPVVTETGVDNSQPTPLSGITPTEFDPRVEYGLTLNVQDQGTVCNSGWAYATASAVQLKSSQQTITNTPVLSAQQLIDCAVTQNACTSQVPKAAFDYLLQYPSGLRPVSEYANNPFSSTPGTCQASSTPITPATGTPVTRYSRLNDGADLLLELYVSRGYPVVIEYNPTSYQFILYGEGVFQQPSTGSGSHFMTVVGYGRDTGRNLDYWLVQNSFGQQWGEQGLIRIIRTASKPLTKSAIFPSVLA